MSPDIQREEELFDEARRLADPAERVVLQVVRALLQTSDLTDEEYAAGRDAIGEQGMVELTTLVGYYATLALQLRVFRVGAPA